MSPWIGRSSWALALCTLLTVVPSLTAQSLDMNFFVVPEGPTAGANFGAVLVSDAHCHDLGYAAGWGHLTWRAYLTGTAEDGEADQVARERIGSGPWYNAAGLLIAESLEQLHSDANNLNRATALTLTGQTLPEGLLEIPPGSRLDGTAFSRSGPFFCFGVPEG